jgi:hypothetical protein
MPLQKPSLPQEAAPPSVHWFSGSMPLGTFVHVPSVPATPHERQVPVHAPMQQKPCSQKPELHWAGAVQAALIGNRPQLVPVQVLGAAQSAVVPQVVRQRPLVPHAKGAQLDDDAVWQVPVPLHVRAGVAVVPVQVGIAHCVPAA